VADTRTRPSSYRPPVSRHSRDPASPLPDRVTMPLLDLVTREAMDQDYVHAARRRAYREKQAHAAGVEPPARRTALRGVAVGMVVFGLLIAMAAVQNSRNADVEQAARSELIARIDARQEVVDGAEKRTVALREENDGLRTLGSRLRGDLGEATVQERRLQISAGFVAVTGPGVRITVDDAPDGSSSGRVRATDLQLLVNGLWQAGAEAVAVNGRRLTVLSALTNSGPAVNDNQQPLTPPYVVSAIGDVRRLSADLLQTGSGLQFTTLAQQYGYLVDPEDAEQLELPAAPQGQLRLRYATEDDGVPEQVPDRSGRRSGEGADDSADGPGGAS
jgi:uncharacterized protein YlxW (UPF0749 family)